MLTCSLGSQALANAKIALLSVAVFAPAAAVMIGNSYLSKHFKERNFHGGVPVVISGIAFLVLPVAIFRGGVVAGFIMLIIAAAGAWAVHGPLWCVLAGVDVRVLLAAGHLSLHCEGWRAAQVVAGVLPGGPRQVGRHRLLQCVRSGRRVCGSLPDRCGPPSVRHLGGPLA